MRIIGIRIYNGDDRGQRSFLWYVILIVCLRTVII
jgi:hypothetical protein